MMKVRDPNGKLSQAGSPVFPLKENCCPKSVYLHLDMLRIMINVCEHVKANLALIKAWNLEVKTYMKFLFEEL